MTIDIHFMGNINISSMLFNFNIFSFQYFKTKYLLCNYKNQRMSTIKNIKKLLGILNNNKTCFTTTYFMKKHLLYYNYMISYNVT